MRLDMQAVKRMLMAERRALQTAARLLWQAHKANRRLTPMQVLKLAYISHGWMLGLLAKPLFGEPVEAWRYGPVIPSIYHQYKDFRGDPISRAGSPHDEELGPEGCSIIDQVLNGYGAYSGLQLSDMTHEDDSPWAVVRRRGDQVIPNVLIQAHYEGLAAKLRGRTNG